MSFGFQTLMVRYKVSIESDTSGICTIGRVKLFMLLSVWV